MISKWISENTRTMGLIGILMIALATLGIWIGNTYTSIAHEGDIFDRVYENSYPYDYLISPSAIVGLIGILGTCPILMKWVLKIAAALWRLFKRALYEVFYEATKAIEDAKKAKNEL